jgi:putative nucleotidyltransferase-like protein
MKVESRQAQHIETFSRLLFRAQPEGSELAVSCNIEQFRRALRYTASLRHSEFSDFVTLANTHHVIVRALTVLQRAAALDDEKEVTDQCERALAAERTRIEQAMGFLQSICVALEGRGCEVAVIKSLDHWPDLGSDLDLYTTSDQRSVERAMREEFGAHPVERSWGDRLANKWNYSVPGLPELVEVHVQYLGQTGEHAELARRVIDRKVSKTVGGREFRVPAPEERIVISALQRVYRHFYFRLCDMVDTASLLQSGAVDFRELKRAANSAGIWPGVATYLCLVENYVKGYAGVVSLPDEVRTSAYSRESKVQFKDGYFRVSKATAAGLYSLQLLQAGRHCDVRALVRLPLLPPLAISALVAHSLTGNDKGIW